MSSPSFPNKKPAGVQPSGEQLSDRARGLWPQILQELVPETAQALAHPGKHFGCPKHGGTNGFRFFKDVDQSGGGFCNTCGAKPNGISIIAWLRDCSTKDAAREVAKYLNGAELSDYTPAPRPVAKEPDFEKLRDAVWTIWTACKELLGTPAARYLSKRGIFNNNLPKTLRFHPSLPYWEDGQMHGYFPAMVAPITDETGFVVSLHRTFLTDTGFKADVPNPKKVMTPCRPMRGSAIKLAPADKPILCVAEGIETALSVAVVTGLPTWSTVSAVLMELVAVPESVEEVWIFADLDRSERGMQAAEKLKERLLTEGKRVRILMPAGPLPEDCKGIDWNDVLNKQGFGGFPRDVRRPRLAAPVRRAA